MTLFLINALTAVLIFIIGELIVNHFVFKKLAQKYPQDESADAGIKLLFLPEPIFRGVLERLVLYVSLNYQFITILVVFGAIKLATRLADDNKKPISNSYFHIGNFASILFAVVYTVTYMKVSVVLSQ